MTGVVVWGTRTNSQHAFCADGIKGLLRLRSFIAFKRNTTSQIINNKLMANFFAQTEIEFVNGKTAEKLNRPRRFKTFG
jgi:glucose-6-phosphate isomerase